MPTPKIIELPLNMFWKSFFTACYLHSLSFSRSIHRIKVLDVVYAWNSHCCSNMFCVQSIWVNACERRILNANLMWNIKKTEKNFARKEDCNVIKLPHTHVAFSSIYNGKSLPRCSLSMALNCIALHLTRSIIPNTYATFRRVQHWNWKLYHIYWTF